MASPFQIAAGLNVAAFLYSPHRRLAVLCDGSLLASTQTSTGTVTLSICTNPTAATQTWSALTQTFSIASSTSIVADLYVASNGTTSSDVWVCLASNDGTNGTSVMVAHGTYTASGSTWSWDNTGTAAMTVSAGSGVASIIWDGTNLIVVSRDGNSTNNRSVQMVWTTTKNGSAGWQAKAALSSVTTGNSHMVCMLRRHPSNLGGGGSGGTICVYINDTGSHSDRLACRVLLDSAASPAVANWSSEVQQAQSALSGIGLSSTVDPSSGKIHVGYTSSVGTGYTGLNYFPITVASGAPTWGTHQNPDTTSTIATTGIGVDVTGQIWLFYGTGSVGSSGVPDYRTSTDGITFSGANTTVATSAGDGYPHVPVDYAMSGFVPFAYQHGTSTFTTQSDNTIVAPTPPTNLSATSASASSMSGTLTVPVALSGAASSESTASATPYAPGLKFSTQIQTGITGGPPGNNGTETDVTHVDANGNGVRWGFNPTYGGMGGVPWYEINANAQSVPQTNLGTSKANSNYHVYSHVGSSFLASEDPVYTLTELSTSAVDNVRAYFDSGTSAQDANGFTWRARSAIFPMNATDLLVCMRIDAVNASSVTTATTDSYEFTELSGLTQVTQGGAIAWNLATAGWGFVGGAQTSPIPAGLTAATEPDYLYAIPSGSSSVTTGLVSIAKQTANAMFGTTATGVNNQVNASRLKVYLQSDRATATPAATHTWYQYLVYRRGLTAAEAASIAADIRNPDAGSIVSVGTPAGTFYDPDEAAYVVAVGASNTVKLTHTFPTNVTERWHCVYKLTGYTSANAPAVTIGGTQLGSPDIVTAVDTTNQVAYVKLLRPIVASGATGTQLNNGQIVINDGSATLALSGSSAESSGASGTLVVAVPLVGSTGGALSASGTATVAVPMSGVSASAGAASGAMVVATPLAGASASSGSASGPALVAANLVGTASSSLGASGSLTVATPLVGTAGQSLAAVGSMAGSSLAGTEAAVSAASGTLTVATPLSGSSGAAQAASGAVVVATSLSGASAGLATASGTLVVSVPLTGATGAVLSASGGVNLAGQMSGVSAAAGAASGTLVVATPLSGGTAAQSSTASGNPVGGTALTGSSASSSAAFGALVVAVALSGSSGGIGSASAALGVVGGLAGFAAAQGSASGSLIVRMSLVGASSMACAAAALLVENLALSGQSDAAALATASFISRLFTSGQVTAPSASGSVT